MNLINFNPSASKIQYDGYKYKLDNNLTYNVEGELSYNKRKLHKYRVNEIIYDLRTEDYFKYLFHVEVDEETWEGFKSDHKWEYYLSSLNLLELVIRHISGLVKFNKFTNIILPEELEDLGLHQSLKLTSLSKAKYPKTLDVRWFGDDYTSVPHPGYVNLAIFHN